MPRAVPDYKSAIVYQLKSSVDGSYYYGHTTQSPRVRLLWHMINAENHPEIRVYRHFNAVGWDSVTITVVRSNLGATLYREVLAVEDAFIKEHIDDPLCLNSLRAILTADEKHAASLAGGRRCYWNHVEEQRARRSQYYIDNRDKELERGRQYREEHHDRKIETARKFRKTHSTSVTCPSCGSCVVAYAVKQHERSKKHQASLQAPPV